MIHQPFKKEVQSRKWDNVPESIYDGPISVVISNRSASGAEIFAGALQANNRAIVVGLGHEHSFGKGSVQRIRYVDSFHAMVYGAMSYKTDQIQGGLWMTTSLYVLSDGRIINNQGVAANLLVSSKSDEVADLERLKEGRLPDINVVRLEENRGQLYMTDIEFADLVDFLKGEQLSHVFEKAAEDVSSQERASTLLSHWAHRNSMAEIQYAKSN